MNDTKNVRIWLLLIALLVVLTIYEYQSLYEPDLRFGEMSFNENVSEGGGLEYIFAMPIYNAGDEDAKDVVVEASLIDNEGNFTEDATKVQVGDIEIEGKREVFFILDVRHDRTYTLKLKAEASNGGDVKSSIDLRRYS